MSVQPNCPPTWARKAGGAIPDLSACQRVGPNLPVWMSGRTHGWGDMRAAMLPHPGRWVRANGYEATRAVRLTAGLVPGAIEEHRNKHSLSHNWRPNQTELETIRLTLPQAPEGHRFVLQQGDTETVSNNKMMCLYINSARVTLGIQAWSTGGKVEASPALVRDDLCYWIAEVQTTRYIQLLMLVTDRELDVRLASPGFVKVWAHGQETILILPVAAAELDPKDDRLGYALSYCKYHNLILPAYRPPEDPMAGGLSGYPEVRTRLD